MSIALAVLHGNFINKCFKYNHQFVHCEQFPASHLHLLNHLSKVIGTEVENPEDFAPLHLFLSLREMILSLDNVESVRV